MSEGGAISGVSPIKDPLSLLLIQIILILTLCRILAVILKRLRQPSVIAEIIAGIILGPSAFGYIPGYMDAIFPPESLPELNLTSTLGLIFYLFIVGLELDPTLLKSRFRHSISISLAGMLVPFAFSVGTAYLLWQTYVPEQPFGAFYLFLGTAMSITAFPVLARILGELHLYTTPVGIQTIAAAAVDDCAAWGLLALVMGIVSASSPLNALYIILLTVGFFLIMMFLGRPFIRRLFSKGLSDDGSVSEWVVISSILIVLVSALITQIIGVHSIFGGFIAGLVMPRDHGFPVALTEKIEDLICKLFLPLYFAYSGLRTNIGVLNDGTAWGMVMLVIVTACVGKILGCFVAARLSKMNTRESLAVGILMNCKGLVELIVLNVGLDARVIDDKIFTIMVLMAIITTFITTPLILWVYPVTYYRKRAAGGEEEKELSELEEESLQAIDSLVTRFNPLFCITAIGFMPILLNFIQMISMPLGKKRQIPIHTMRLLESSERSSSIIKVTHRQEVYENDPLSQLLRTYGKLNNIEIVVHVGIAALEEIADEVCETAELNHLDLIVIPWRYRRPITDSYDINQDLLVKFLMRKWSKPIAVTYDRGIDMTSQMVKILVPFFGGPDCREALRLAIRIGAHPGASVHVLVIDFPSNEEIKNVQEVFDETENASLAAQQHQTFNNAFHEQDRRLLDQLRTYANQNPESSISIETIKGSRLAPTEALLGHAKEDKYSLIVFGYLGSKLAVFGGDIKVTGSAVNNIHTFSSPGSIKSVQKSIQRGTWHKASSQEVVTQSSIRSMFGGGPTRRDSSKHDSAAGSSTQGHTNNTNDQLLLSILGETGKHLIEEESVKASLIAVRKMQIHLLQLNDNYT